MRRSPGIARGRCSSRATSSSRRSSSRPLPTASSSPAQNSTSPRPSWQRSSVSRRPASPESRRLMISSRRAVGALVGLVGLASCASPPGRRRSSHRPSPSPKNSRTSPSARACAARGDDAARAVVDDRVAARDRPLGVVGGQRGGQASPARRAARGPAGRRRRPPCAAERRARGAPCARGRRPTRRRARRAARSAAGAARRGGARRLGGRARERREVARAADDRAARVGLQAPRRSAPAPARASQRMRGHRGLGGVRRRRAADRGDVVDQRAVGVVADRRDHRHAQQRDRAAQRLVAEREQVGQRAAAARDDDDLDLLDRREVLQRVGDRAARRGGPAPARTPTPAGPAQPRRRSPASTSSRALPPSPVTTPMHARQRRARQALLRLEQALGAERGGAAPRAGRAGRPRRRPAGR